MLLRLLELGNPSNSLGGIQQSMVDAEDPSATIPKCEGLGDGVWRSHERIAGLDNK